MRVLTAVRTQEAAHDSQQSEAPRKGTRVLSEEVQDLQRNLQAFDGDYWQPMKRYADDGTELKGRETKAQLKQRLAQYKSLRTQRLTQGARPPRAVGASDSDSDDVQVEPQKVRTHTLCTLHTAPTPTPIHATQQQRR